MAKTATEWRDLLRPGLRERVGGLAPHRRADMVACDHANYIMLYSWDARTEIVTKLDVAALNAAFESDPGDRGMFVEACRKVLPTKPKGGLSDAAAAVSKLINAQAQSPTAAQIEACLRSVLDRA